MLLRPRAGEVLRGALRCGDAAAHGKVDVAVSADLSVSLQQHVIEIDPGVVAASMPVLDLHDDLIVRVGSGDGQHVPDLLGGAGLEGNIGEAVLMQAGEELAGFLHFWDAGRDAHTIERRTGRTGLGHDACLAKLQVPQEAIEEHGVELRSAARVQVLFHDCEVGTEDLIGVHATAGHLRPVSGVCRRGHDLTVSGGRSHAAQHDGGETREIRKTRLRDGAPAGKFKGARSKVSVVQRSGKFSAGGGERVDGLRGGGLHDDDSGALHRAARDGGQCPVEDDEVSSVQCFQRLGPRVLGHEDGLCVLASGLFIQTAFLRQRHGAFSGHGEHRVMERQGHGQLVETCFELIAADSALLQGGIVLCNIAFNRRARCRKVVRIAGKHEVPPPIHHGNGSCSVQALDKEVALDPTHRQHLRAGIGTVDRRRGRAHEKG